MDRIHAEIFLMPVLMELQPHLHQHLLHLQLLLQQLLPLHLQHLLHQQHQQPLAVQLLQDNEILTEINQYLRNKDTQYKIGSCPHWI